jgi:hypothetical protein
LMFVQVKCIQEQEIPHFHIFKKFFVVHIIEIVHSHTLRKFLAAHIIEIQFAQQNYIKNYIMQFQILFFGK